MKKPTVVHVIGTGTIGEPLIGLLVSLRQPLGIDEVSFHKRTPLLTDRSKVTNLLKRGARLAVDADARQGFVDLGIRPEYESHEALARATVVIDCTPSSVGLANKTKFYEKYLDQCRGFIAQGSEFGFGRMYARGINDRALRPGEDRFIQVVSCNTHNLSILIDLVALAGGGPENLEEARFLCIRRANDISQDGSFVPAPQVNKHKDENFGTHHARDAHHLFRTLGYDLRNLFSSSMVVNTQYMHAIWFAIRVRKPVTREEILGRFEACDRVAITHKTSANTVFSFGRDYGHFGRILNETVVVAPALTVRDGHEVIGFCFTPQDGNSLLSSVAAASWFIDPNRSDERIQCLKPYFYDEV